jgi:hypothetical protein
VKGRLTVGALGVLLAAYGVFRLLSQTKISHPRELAEWLAAAVVIHDGLVVPATMALGAAVSAFVPARARRYLQGSLVCAAVITVPALVLIRPTGRQGAGEPELRRTPTGHPRGRRDVRPSALPASGYPRSAQQACERAPTR